MDKSARPHRYSVGGQNKVLEILKRLVDVNNGEEFNRSWAEGYVSALADNGIIKESEFDQLVWFIGKL